MVSTYYDWYAEVDDALQEGVLQGIDSGAELTDHAARLDRLIAEGKKHRASLTGAACMKVAQQLDRLATVVVAEELRRKVRDLHEEPFFIGFFGPPKIGKTHILNQVARYAAHVRGRQYHPDRTFVWGLSDQFASGLTNHTETIVLDDVGTVDHNVSAQHALAPVLEIMSLANDQPAATNQANLADKGKIFARPNLVLVTSNDSTFGVRKTLKNPEACLRRIRYKVQMTVLPEFRAHDADGNELFNIDPDLASKQPAGTPMHAFTVSEFVLKPRSGAPQRDAPFTSVDGVLNAGVAHADVVDKVILGKAGPVPAQVFWAWLTETMRNHYARVSVSSERSKEMVHVSICDRCSMISSACVCASTGAQEKYEPQVFGWCAEMAHGFLSTHVFDRCRDARKVLVAAGVQRVMASFGPLRGMSLTRLAGIFTHTVARRIAEVLGVMAVSAYLHSPNVTFERRYDAVHPLGEPQKYDAQSWVQEAVAADKGSETDVYARGFERSEVRTRKGATVSPETLVGLVKKATGVVTYESVASLQERDGALPVDGHRASCSQSPCFA